MLHIIFITLATMLVGGAQTASDVPQLAAVQSELIAEDQTPSGKFTTATEVKPILTMTTGNWVAVREWDGKDLIYVTHLWSWRCGLAQLEIGVNGGPLEVWELPPCHIDTAQPNAVLDSDGLPYRSFALKSVEQVKVRLTLDDLTVQEASFERKAILLP